MILWCSKIHQSPFTSHIFVIIFRIPAINSNRFEDNWILGSEEATVKGTKEFMKWWRDCCESSCLSELSIDLINNSMKIIISYFDCLFRHSIDFVSSSLDFKIFFFNGKMRVFLSFAFFDWFRIFNLIW